MITKSSPSEIEWVTGPLPNPDSVHPDCEIIIWFNAALDGDPEVRVLRSKEMKRMSWEEPGEYIRFRWYDTRNFIWEHKYNKVLCWGWWKYFR